MRILLAAAVAAPLCVIWSGAMAQGSGPVKPIVVTAIKGDAAPKLDGIGDDAVWKKAPAAKFTAIKGVNFKDNGGTTTGTIQVAYVGDTIYFLLTYDDPTQIVPPFAVRQGPGRQVDQAHRSRRQGRRQQQGTTKTSLR